MAAIAAAAVVWCGGFLGPTSARADDCVCGGAQPMSFAGTLEGATVDSISWSASPFANAVWASQTLRWVSSLDASSLDGRSDALGDGSDAGEIDETGHELRVAANDRPTALGLSRDPLEHLRRDESRDPAELETTDPVAQALVAQLVAQLTGARSRGTHGLLCSDAGDPRCSPLESPEQTHRLDLERTLFVTTVAPVALPGLTFASSELLAFARPVADEAPARIDARGLERPPR